MRLEIPLLPSALLVFCCMLLFLSCSSRGQKAVPVPGALPPAAGVPGFEKTASAGHGSRAWPSAPAIDSPQLIYDVLNSNPDAFKPILDHADAYEVQILYTQIERGPGNEPSFKHYAYRVNPQAYFNPASLVKLPVACLALQKLKSLQLEGLDKNTRLSIGKHHSCQTSVSKDATAPEGRPTIAHYIKKALLVSDNDAYNRLYEFLGQEYIHKALRSLGYENVRIVRRFSSCSAEENRFTNPFTFYSRENKIVYAQPMQISQQVFKNPLPDVKKGIGYFDPHGRYVHKPFDYTYSNSLSLQDIHTMLMSVVFPGAFSRDKRFLLSDADYRFLAEFLSMLPGESGIAAYKDCLLYPDNYKKYLIIGDAPRTEKLNSALRIFNVVGRSDGYLSDCAYIIDPANKIEFFLSAVIYVNEDGVLNDGKYEYAATGLPFLGELGRAMYNYEKTRRIH